MNVLRTVVTTVLFILTVIVASIVILTGTRELYGYRVYTVTSGSMEPTISTGSLIVVRARSDYGVNDIATYKSPTIANKIVTHRIVEETRKADRPAYIFKGDANDARDVDVVPQTNLIGAYLFGIPLIGYVIEFARTPMGAILLIVIPGTIIIWEEIKNIKQIFSVWKQKTSKQAKSA